MKPKSLGHAVTIYIEELEKRDCSQAHIRTVRSRLARFTQGRTTKPLASAQGDLGQYFRELRESGLASGTLAGHKATQLAFWRWCADRQWCALHEISVLQQRSNNYSFRPVHSRKAPASDFAAVVACLPAFAAHRAYLPRDVRDAALVSLIADSACRRGEAWNLRRAAVITALSRPDTLAHRRVYRVESEGKTGRVQIRFFDETAELLRRWTQHVPESTGYVFLSLQTGRRLRIDAMQLGLRRICEFAGVPLFGFHSMRKRVVTDAIAASGDPKIGQMLAGHTSERTTLTYYNDIDQAQVDATAALLADRYRHGNDGDNLIRSFFGR